MFNQKKAARKKKCIDVAVEKEEKQKLNTLINQKIVFFDNIYLDMYMYSIRKIKILFIVILKETKHKHCIIAAHHSGEFSYKRARKNGNEQTINNKPLLLVQ